MVLSHEEARLFKTVEESVRPLCTKKATVLVVLATYTSIEPPEVGTVSWSLTT